MAPNATIFKATLHIADVGRYYYEDHTLTPARHPSETDERMMVRLLAFALHAHEALLFGRGLSTGDEPALWQKDLTGLIELWSEVGRMNSLFARPAVAPIRSASIPMAVALRISGGKRTSPGWSGCII